MVQVEQVVVVRASNSVAGWIDYHLVPVGHMRCDYLGSSKGDLLIAFIQLASITGIDRE